jgi:hypothetical protein
VCVVLFQIFCSLEKIEQMNSRSLVVLRKLALAALTTSAVVVHAISSFPSIDTTSTTLTTDSEIGRRLLAHSHPLNGEYENHPLVRSNDVDHNKDNNSAEVMATSYSRRLDDDSLSFITKYSIKFQGCHHISQWNDQAKEADDVRILTKRLARFRLCPSDSCANEKSTGCKSKYGDYIVDMNTFVSSYLQAMVTDKETICKSTKQDCEQSCANADDDGVQAKNGNNDQNGNGINEESCLYQCYDAYDATSCLFADQYQNFDPSTYSSCAQYKFVHRNRGRRLEESPYTTYGYTADSVFYLGPYCAEQGGEIHLGLFTDDSCTAFATEGDKLFYALMGYELPYSNDSLVSTRCLKCSASDETTKQVCTDVYALSGKCETKMSISYPNESSCDYIEGIKIVRQDGSIRSSTTRKSKTAAVAIGVFMTLSVLLAGYVYYLRTKLTRAQINLTAASAPLTG